MRGSWREPGDRVFRGRHFFKLLAWFRASAWFDATTPPGIALLASTIVFSGLIAWQGDENLARSMVFVVLLAAPCFVTGTRLQLPVSAEEALLLLREHADRTELTAVLAPHGGYQKAWQKQWTEEEFEELARAYPMPTAG